MIIYILFLLIATAGLLYNWKKATLILIPMTFIMNDGEVIRMSPMVPLAFAIDVMIIVTFYFSPYKKRIRGEDFVLKWAFIATLISYVLSSLFSMLSWKETWLSTLRMFIISYIIMYYFQTAIQGPKDIKLTIKCTSIALLSAVILGIYESVTNDNPVLNFVYNSTPEDFLQSRANFWYIPGGESVRFGLRRCFSFFSIHIDFGCYCALFFFLFLFLYKSKSIYIRQRTSLLLVLMGIIGALLSNSKTPIVGLLFFSLSIFGIKEIFKPRTIVLVIVAVGLFLILMPDYLNIIYSLFDSNLAEEGGGSTADLRERQYDVGMYIFSMNPILGNGVGSMQILHDIGNNSDIMGAESSLLKILPERGIVGLIAYLISNYVYFFKTKRTLKTSGALLFVLGVMAMEFATGLLQVSYIAYIVIVIYKMSQFPTILHLKSKKDEC